MSKPWDETGWWANAGSVWAEDGDLIATVNYSVDAAHDSDFQERARMMAAAPELYLALESALDAMNETKDARCNAAILDASAALRKARGE